jgi:tRNA uridine 5-carboxymethylaminomethyl modification enzyme
MFTSRAEYRLMLREDNADLRLTEKGRELGLISDEQWQIFCEKREHMAIEQERLRSTWIQAGSPEAEQVEAKIETKLLREYSLYDLLKRPELTYADVASLKGEPVANEAAAEQIEIEAKYSGYINRQQEDIERMRAYENTLIPEDLDYTQVEGLSNEVKQKLAAARPQTLARASRISGVTPAAVSLIMVYLKKRGLLRRLKDGAPEQQAS